MGCEMRNAKDKKQMQERLLKAVSNAKNREHLWETDTQRMVRKAKEYAAENNIANTVRDASEEIRFNSIRVKQKDVEEEPDTETKEEICVLLFADNEIIICKEKVKGEKYLKKNGHTIILQRIAITDMPDEIKQDGVKQNADDLARQIIEFGRAVKIYKVLGEEE